MLIPLRLAVFLVCAVLGADIFSQDYPTKPIQIFTSSVGGGNDFDARQIAQGISKSLGQPLIVNNRTPSTLSAEIVAKAPPDGYSLLVAGALHWVLPLLRKAPYDVTEFASISLIDTSVSVVVVHPSLPVKSIKELIALAKAKPGQLNYSTSAIGSAPHLSAELFKSMAAINIVHVPYKGSAAAMSAVIGGEAQMTISGPATLQGQLKSGKLRALAVTSAQPSSLAPGLPTVAASGLPGYESLSMTALFTTAKTPRPIINRINQEVVRFLKMPETKERFFNVGVEIVGSSPDELTSAMNSDIARWAKVIRDADIKAD